MITTLQAMVLVITYKENKFANYADLWGKCHFTKESPGEQVSLIGWLVLHVVSDWIVCIPFLIVIKNSMRICWFRNRISVHAMKLMYAGITVRGFALHFCITASNKNFFNNRRICFILNRIWTCL